MSKEPFYKIDQRWGNLYSWVLYVDLSIMRLVNRKKIGQTDFWIYQKLNLHVSSAA